MVPIDGAQVRLPKTLVQYIIMISIRLEWADFTNQVSDHDLSTSAAP